MHGSTMGKLITDRSLGGPLIKQKIQLPVVGWGNMDFAMECRIGTRVFTFMIL